MNKSAKKLITKSLSGFLAFMTIVTLLASLSLLPVFAADEEEEAYYESLKTEVEEQYTDYMYSQSRNDMFIGSGQLSSINRFMMI